MQIDESQTCDSLEQETSPESTASAPAGRVRTSATQDSAPESTENAADCGSMPVASLANYDPTSRSWKTSQLCLDGEWGEYSETFPKSGMTRNGRLYPLPTLAHRTSGTVSGLWPTPQASDVAGGARMPDGKRGLSLREVAVTGERMWPTIRSADADRGGRGDLIQAVRGNPNSHYKWPTPHGNCHTGAGLHGDGGPNLQTAVRTWPTPCSTMHKGSSPAALTRKNGRSRHNDRLDHATQARQGSGSLNPLWVEWLMGYPPNWTVVE